MDARIARNRQFLADLFAGPFRGHALIADPELEERPFPGDYTVSPQPVSAWLPWILRNYEAALRRSEALDDDAVPYVPLTTGTGVFAAAFGCPIHIYEDSLPAARPRVFSAQEADRLPQPNLHAPTIERFFELARLVRERVGPDVPVGIVDIQSAFDVAALVWNKQDLFLALLDQPEAVLRLVDKCQTLLKAFWDELLRLYPECNLCHCPRAWAPPALGVWLSEDEAGSLSTRMFQRFCLPYLVDLSQTYGGLFVHCCAAADHQYANLARIPNLRGLNRVFQEPGPEPAVRAFAGQTVLMVAWTEEADVLRMLAMAQPNSRFLFNLPAQPLDEARRSYERIRARIRALCQRD